MYVPLKIKTDYSLLKSTIKVENLMKFLEENKIQACAICDENLYGVLDFYLNCQKNNIKPLIGLEVKVENKVLNLYAKNYKGYQNLLKIHTKIHQKEITIDEINNYKEELLGIVSYKNYVFFKNLNLDLYIGYENEFEKNECLKITNKRVYINDIKVLKKEDTFCLQYLDLIAGREKGNYQNVDYRNYDWIEVDKIEEIVDKLNVVIPFHQQYIPQFKANVDSEKFLYSLAFKGLEVRLKGNIPAIYENRLRYELSVIKNMGFVDYFLIVYDYVLFAKKNNIMVGPGRGSAAGSLVSYVLGIIDIDPLKYGLIFERFLNPGRKSMPDIDIDFDANKRNLVIEYVKNKYGLKNVAGGITFNTMQSRSILRELAKILKIDDNLMNDFIINIEAKKTLVENWQNKKVKNYVKNYQELYKLYSIALKLEGLKKNVSRHAAGLVISNKQLDEVIPTYQKEEVFLTGVPMEYLEDVGLLKMDLLSIDDITVIANILDKIGHDKLKNINLEDPNVYKLFANLDVDGIFQFRTPVMKSLLKKFIPHCFKDLVDEIALVRPGPKDFADLYIKRRDKKENITYLHPDLEPILKSTYGILIYQEQIISILRKIGGYTLSEADIIRRAISKKDEKIIEEEKIKFIEKAKQNGYSESFIMQIYDQISSFANFGFNKSHSVAYALIAFQLAYLKTYYPAHFFVEMFKKDKTINIFNYLTKLKKQNFSIIKPSVLNRFADFEINEKNLILPLTLIKGIDKEINKKIIEINYDGFKDYFDFILKTKNILDENKIKALIQAGALDCFGLNHKTLEENIDNALNYAILQNGDETNLIRKPLIIEYDEYPKNELRLQELESFGFYINDHPCNIYEFPEYMKLKDLKKYLFKKVKCAILITNIKKIKTKNNKDMAFIDGNDDTDEASFTVFEQKIHLINDLEKNDVIIINGEVQKRYDQYSIIVSNINKVKK